MLNARKLKKDVSPNVLREGKDLYDQGMILSAKINHLDSQNVRLCCQVMGGFEKKYTCEMEIDRVESMVIDSDCDCPYQFDCQHLAAIIFYLEDHFDEILVNYSKETDLEKVDHIDEEDKEHLRETFKAAETKEQERKGKEFQKELLEEYVSASQILGKSPFFLPQEKLSLDVAELACIFSKQAVAPQEMEKPVDIQLALRLPFRSKPLHILHIKPFLEAMRYQEPLYIGNRRYFFTLDSFEPTSRALLKMIMDFARVADQQKDERNLRIAQIDVEPFGTILAEAYDLALSRKLPKQPRIGTDQEMEYPQLPCFYCGSLEEPLRFSHIPSALSVELEYLETPTPKILLNPSILIDGNTPITLEQARLFECAKPGFLEQQTYYRFASQIRRTHLNHLSSLREITIPEPLFGAFVENSIAELSRFAVITNRQVIDRFVTLPFVGELRAECRISYLNGELEASLEFLYDNVNVPAATSQLSVDNIISFVTPSGILARNLTEEQKIIEDLFQDFLYDPYQGVYKAKNDKKIVEFMTEIVPRNQSRVNFHCPENLLEQFIYDDTRFTLRLKETDRIDMYLVDLEVDGHLSGVTLDILWECLTSKRTFIELVRKKTTKNKNGGESTSTKLHKILVLDLEKIAPVVQIFDEIGINRLDNHQEERPLWSLASIDASQFENLPITFSMSDKLKHIQQQMISGSSFMPSKVPQEINATLREYQTEGVSWLERLRTMHLNGVLADDMGLGKTLQAIIALTQHKINFPKSISIIVCPTSLVYNWKEEFNKFNPKLKVLPIDGTPAVRQKLIAKAKKQDVLITSYSLLQKDIDFYKEIPFDYAVLDEAQHIKNRGTRNAKSVKMIQAMHRLILTGTPIENSLDELWSLFDFLMPGLLSSYDRFLEKYIRNPTANNSNHLETLKKKVSPFILRRMKKDVLEELPPVSEIVYHCHLSEAQRELYRSYAESAREELSQLVKKEGFNKVQIHVLATLTRLKQICCHPAIFAKERAEMGDSSKYDMLMELLQTLIEGKHKTVIFSQYTRMLQIMRDDLEQLGIKFEYLDGSSKNRLSIVNNFNEDESIPVFLVSLKAGGSGLNLTGADTVIHYDMWWNPAVENQATDRVHRIGQQKNVSSYKLVTLNTIEEKIIDLQNRKRGLVKKVVSCDEEAISKLTWEEVLALLQT